MGKWFPLKSTAALRCSLSNTKRTLATRDPDPPTAKTLRQNRFFCDAHQFQPKDLGGIAQRRQCFDLKDSFHHVWFSQAGISGAEPCHRSKASDLAWRYEPIAAGREYRVDLIVGGEEGNFATVCFRPRVPSFASEVSA